MNFFSVSVMILQKPLAMSETKKRQTAFMDLKCGKIFGEGVSMTFVACSSCNLEILGVLNATVFLTSENIGNDIAPQASPLPMALY